MVRTQRFHCLGPGWGTKILQNKKCSQKKKSLNRVKVKVLGSSLQGPTFCAIFFSLCPPLLRRVLWVPLFQPHQPASRSKAPGTLPPHDLCTCCSFWSTPPPPSHLHTNVPFWSRPSLTTLVRTAGTSLVVQWLRLCTLPLQEARVWSLFGELDPTCHS